MTLFISFESILKFLELTNCGGIVILIEPEIEPSDKSEESENSKDQWEPK